MLSQEKDYSLDISLDGDSCIHVIFSNYSKKTIEFENPHIFKNYAFTQSPHWDLVIQDSLDESIDCLNPDGFINIFPHVKKIKLKLKNNDQYEFEIPLKIDEIICIGSKKEERVMVQKFKINLRLKLIRPNNTIIVSNSLFIPLE